MTHAIGISVGDIWGISPEIIFKALLGLNQQNKSQKIIVYGNKNLLEQLASEQSLIQYWQKVECLPNIEWQSVCAAERCAKDDQILRATIAKASLDQGIADAMSKKIKALVTAPLDKAVMQLVIKGFQGHTEYLKDKAQVKRTWMMLDNSELNVVLLTNHLLLKDVARNITAQNIKQAVTDITIHFKQLSHTSPVRIAVCALNPHCGELSPTSEEKTIMEPAIKELQQQGYAVEGPFSADALFAKARNNSYWTAILAMYHDQGLVAAKYPGQDASAINITLGLPFIRVSPGHGVAYDLVGKNQARWQSMTKAIEYVQQQIRESA